MTRSVYMLTFVLATRTGVIDCISSKEVWLGRCGRRRARRGLCGVRNQAPDHDAWFVRHIANDLLRRVADGDVVRAIIGHSTEQMTHHYSHVDETEKRAAAMRAFGRCSRTERGVTKGVAPSWMRNYQKHQT